MSHTLVEESELGEQTGSPCVACRLPLPIQPAPVSEAGEYRLCKKCGTRHHGVLLADVPREIAENVLPGEKKKASVVSNLSTSKKPVSKDVMPSRGPVVCDLETNISRALDKSIENGRSLAVEIQGQPFLDIVEDHGVNPYDTLVEAEFAQKYEHSCNQVEELVVALEKGGNVDLSTSRRVTRDSLSQAAEDMDLFVKLGINPPDRDYAGKHNYHVAMLAASMAASLGWDEQTISDVGIGCLLHDIGMNRVPEEVVQSPRILSAGEFIDIARHPIYTFDMLEDHFQNVPTISRMVAYQIHERCDGSGYPRNRRGASIHEAARLAAVADVYVALISPRPHRPAMMPHYAVKHLLFGVRDGKFDSQAVRALLQTISAFPIGSCLELKDGRVGQVMRARAEHYARPVVALWKPDQLNDAPEIVDLSEKKQIEVLRPLAALSA